MGKPLSEADVFAITLPVACWLRSILEGESDGAGPFPGVAKLNRDDKRESVTPAATEAWAAAKGSDAAAAEAASAKFLTAAFGPGHDGAAPALVELLKLLQSGGVKAALEAVSAKASR